MSNSYEEMGHRAGKQNVHGVSKKFALMVFTISWPVLVTFDKNVAE